MLRPETWHFTSPFVALHLWWQVFVFIRFVPQLGRMSTTKKNACLQASWTCTPNRVDHHWNLEGQDARPRSLIHWRQLLLRCEPSVQGSSGARIHSLAAGEPSQFNSPSTVSTRQTAIDSRTVLVGSGSTERAVDARRHADQRPHRATE